MRPYQLDFLFLGRRLETDTDGRHEIIKGGVAQQIVSIDHHIINFNSGCIYIELCACNI
jgi:hypothetical protein